MNFSLQPVRVSTGSEDEEGRLLFADQRLVALLVQLSGQHPDVAGEWYLEAGFGRLDGPEHPIFPSLEAAQAWVAARLPRAGMAKLA